MRILYIDIDSLRPDHLGCYGYHRNTSPHIDAVAQESVRFTNVYATDAPCAPSRTALWSGKFGYKTGLVAHGGTAGQPYVEGQSRNFRDQFDATSWMSALRQAGYHTATISSFGERHAVWHWYAGYNEIINPGYGGHDRADQVNPLARDWLTRNGQNDNWFLHVNYWDPHTPYRTPTEFGNPFANDPLPDWLTEEVRQKAWDGFGPHSAQEVHGYGREDDHTRFPRLPENLDTMDAVKQWIDGYDVGIRYADEHIGQLFTLLKEMGIWEDTAVIISADHGENQGELNVWGDHQTADQITCNIPLIIRWPGLTDTPQVNHALHYHFDWAATLVELAGGAVPDSWDGQSFAEAFKGGAENGRNYLITSQGAWACQRGIRFDDYFCLQTYHDGLKEVDPMMLFNIKHDPHEQHNLVSEQPEVVNQALRHLAEWQADMMKTSPNNVDPLMTVMREGGPFHTRGELPNYIQRLKDTGRAHHAKRLMQRHPDEI